MRWSGLVLPSEPMTALALCEIFGQVDRVGTRSIRGSATIEMESGSCRPARPLNRDR